MKRLLFIAVMGTLLIVGCSNQNKVKEPAQSETTEQTVNPDDELTEDQEGAIDDSGEIVDDSIAEIEGD